MKLALVSPCFPTDRGGVAAHTALLHASLSKLAEVERVAGPGLIWRRASAVAERLRQRQCEGVVLQYTPNLYGWSNFFPFLLLRALKKRRIRSLTIFHEIFMPEYRGFARSLLQRPVNFCKDWLCLKTTDFPAVTLSWRARTLETLFNLRAHVLPVSSALPLYQGAPVKKEFLFSVFGAYHHDMNLNGILKALALFSGEKALFIGEAPLALASHPQVKVTGYLPDKEAAAALHRAGLFVMFDRRGISFRKSSSAAALLNGIPVIANRTAWTDREFRDGENVCLYDGTVEGLVAAIRRLKADPALTERIISGGRALYDRCLACDKVAQLIVEIMRKGSA